MIRSPRLASATSSARRPAGGIRIVSTSPSAWASTSAGRPGELADLGEELAGPLLDQRLAPAEAVAQADRHLAREQR